MIDKYGYDIATSVRERQAKQKSTKESLSTTSCLSDIKCEQERRTDIESGDMNPRNVPVNLVVTGIKRHVSHIEFD